MSVKLRRNSIRSRWSDTSANINVLYPALALLVSVFAVAPLAYPGFFQSYTGYSAVYNLIDLHQHLGSVWSWSAQWGRAYDFLRMDGPLGYWVAELLHLVGFSFLNAIKLVYALAFFASAYGMFKLAQHVLKNDGAALLAAIVYVYFPVHISAVYIRGAFGEAILWGLMPFALWVLLSVQAREKRTWLHLLAVAILFAATILAQPGLGILFVILTRVWLLVLGPKLASERGFFRSPAINLALLGALFGILLQVTSILQQNALSDRNGFVDAFVYPFQLLSATWGADQPASISAASFPAAVAAPYQIGIAALGLTILALALLFRNRRAGGGDPAVRRVTYFAVITSAVILLLMLPFAAVLWQIVGLDLLMQYPFQLLIFVGFLLPFAAGSILLSDVRFQEIPLLAALVIVPVLAVYPYLSPEFLDLSPNQPALARFNNDELALLDAKILRPPGDWRHGATVQLALTWQALRQPDHGYTVFLHVVDDNGKTWGGVDEKPEGNTLSTLNWVPGRVISDTHTVQIDLNGPPSGYHMEVGVYPSPAGDRAPTETGADSIRIDPNQ